MAKVGSFVTVTNISGALGGEIFGKGISGPTLRMRAKPASTTSTAQQGVQNIMTSATSAASALTSAQIIAWTAYANTLPKTNATSGATYYPSWQNAFIANYVYWNLANGISALPPDPPATPFADDDISTTWTSTVPGQLTITASGPNSSSNITLVYFGKYTGTHAHPNIKRLKFKGAFKFTPTSLTYTFTDLPANQVYTAAIREVDATTGAGGVLRDVVLTATAA